MLQIGTWILLVERLFEEHLVLWQCLESAILISTFIGEITMESGQVSTAMEREHCY